jgi:hypothetical protein
MAYMTQAAKSNTCPHCGQPMPRMRHGVRMYAQTARIFDLIEDAGSVGIETRELYRRAYAGMRKPKINLGVIQAHLRHARKALRGTGVRILGERVADRQFRYYIQQTIAVSSCKP